MLTAAHCTYGKHPASDWTARVGMHNYTDWAAQPHCPDSVQSDTQSIAVAEILEHPNYRPWDKTWDVAILTLASPIAFSATAAPICLPASVVYFGETVFPQYTGQVATVAGWGAVDNFNTWNTSGNWSYPNWGDYPDILQEVQQTVVSNIECEDAYEENGYGAIIDR